jgi:hypothetical protein
MIKIKAVFMNQWHQPLPAKPGKDHVASVDELGVMVEGMIVPVPFGAVFMKVTVEVAELSEPMEDGV